MEDLLTLEYVKAEKNLPNLKSTYDNVVQLIKYDFLFAALKLSKNEDIITLQILAELSCLRIFIQDQKHNISEIKIEGLDSEMIMRPSVTEINAKLRNIIVLDSDINAVYKKAFIDNFQAGKQALAEATVQAAGRAATGVKELAQRSSRMALDVNIKAPVVVIPQSPVSENVFVADFGLITMTNTFHVITDSQTNPPPIIDLITVKLSEMRLYRTQFINDAYQDVLDLLLPLNLEVIVERNLSWEWYQEVPCFNVNAHLKPMEVLQPCDLFCQATQISTDPQVIDLSVKSLTLKMKKKAKKAIVESGTEEENYKVPEYKTVITIHSKDQLNITLSKCGLVMLNNLVKGIESRVFTLHEGRSSQI
ncbi:hypothetical protein CB1_001144017, partial [Camelus ferus]